ncbi:MAG: phosphoribosylaminoimidazolesuccinocarboxamide synthase [Candidatus Omnitrophica bacterium]|nr:phosphoribosylaminoimidazolesuccinocarboxamide synthase [Candidatus Omnitrophota bacterium]
MIYHTDIKELKLFKKGKVRDVYEINDNLLFVATDRISCFDYILPTAITDKGKLLTQISLFWFDYLSDIIENHLITADFDVLPKALSGYRDVLEDRFMIVKKTEVIPFECVVRGYISGSAWKEYQAKQSVCGLALPSGLLEFSKLETPIFTPATKAEAGHDENVDFDYMASKIGLDLAAKLMELSLKIYSKARDYASQRGIIIADTKFEFGLDGDRVILIDEVLTPDSSRFWPSSNYQPGSSSSPISFDKQFVRDYLETTGWDKNSNPPELPKAVVEKTLEKYKEALSLLIQ